MYADVFAKFMECSDIDEEWNEHYSSYQSDIYSLSDFHSYELSERYYIVRRRARFNMDRETFLSYADIFYNGFVETPLGYVNEDVEVIFEVDGDKYRYNEDPEIPTDVVYEIAYDSAIEFNFTMYVDIYEDHVIIRSTFIDTVYEYDGEAVYTFDRYECNRQIRVKDHTIGRLTLL